MPYFFVWRKTMETYTVKVTKNYIKWFKKGTDQLHRTDGPAIEYPDGYKAWYLYGRLHRTNGPAIEYSDGGKEWWVDGKNLTEEEFNKRTNPCTIDNKIVVIDGKKYKLTEV
jgi:hypothetical protein